MQNNFKIDKIDKKLLIVLGEDARLSHNEIGKIIGTSRDVVRYRMKKLEDLGIIRKYLTYSRNRLFGIENYSVSISLQNTDKKIERKILYKIKNLDYVKLLLQCSGDIDINILLGAKNRIHLAQIVDRITGICGEHLQKIHIDIPIKVLKHESYDFLLDDFLYKKEKPAKKTKSKNNENIKELSFTDKELIKLLSTNARAQVIDLAEFLKITPETVSKKIKYLIKENIITKSGASISFNKLGFERYLVTLNLNYYSKELEDQVKDIILRTKEIVFAEKVLGSTNIRLSILAKDHNNFLNSIDKLKSHLKKDLSKLNFSLVKDELKKTPYFGS